MNTVAKEILKKVPTTEKIGNPCSALMKMDPEFEEAVVEAREEWLASANEVLNDIIRQIKAKVNDGECSLKELVLALDTISKKWNIAMGKPT